MSGFDAKMIGMQLYETNGAVLPPEACPHVVFAVPSFTHSVSKRFLISMSQTSWLLHQEGLQTGFMHRDGDCFVAKARNKLVGDFMHQFPASQNFFFIDDDVGWEPQKVIDFLKRPQDIVCGAYPKKQEEVDFPVNFRTLDGALIEEDGLVAAQLAPTGFMRIKRPVLERLTLKCRTFRDREPDGTEKWFPYIFETGVGDDGWWWGEDYTFCVKCHNLDIPIWVDPNIDFYHQGSWNWRNNLSKYLDIARQKAVALQEMKGQEVDGDEPQMLSVSQMASLRANVEQALHG